MPSSKKKKVIKPKPKKVTVKKEVDWSGWEYPPDFKF
jgi:hypothetical protein